MKKGNERAQKIFVNLLLDLHHGRGVKNTVKKLNLLNSRNTKYFYVFFSNALLHALNVVGNERNWKTFIEGMVELTKLLPAEE